MCGIAGLFHPAGQANQSELYAAMERMARTLSHRGPDDFGTWCDVSAGIALGHARLAVVDLSEQGHQPMHGADGRLTLTFNGEIYNYQALRDELIELGHAFAGQSDTEVLLAAIREWGVREAAQRARGMFSFAAWDHQRRELTLCRDRLGIKPLYYGFHQGRLLFASELKAFRADPSFGAEIDRDALALFARHGYIPAPHSIYKSTFKLPAGTTLCLTAKSLKTARPLPYWKLADVVEQGRKDRFTGTEEEALNELDRLLREAVRLRQVMADVPLGAFLSGGIDSSTVVALMQAQSTRPIKTFTIGFSVPNYNEAEYAKAVAKHLGTEHTEHYCSPQDAQDVIPKLAGIYDEPFADASQIPTYLVCQQARRDVTVCLSGDGGDELFGGYDRYLRAAEIWRKVSRLPRWVRSPLAAAIRTLVPAGSLGVPGRKARTLAEYLALRDGRSTYAWFNAIWRHPNELLVEGQAPATAMTDPGQWPQTNSLCEHMMFVDAVTYLPDDILTKVDRASMAVGLEARVPMLDHQVMEFAWRLPLEIKQSEGRMKGLLVKLLERYVPRHLTERPKVGFGVPLHEWLRGPLREWADDLLSGPSLESQGFFRPEIVRQRWREHLAEKQDWQYQLWTVLMFQAWLAEQE